MLIEEPRNGVRKAVKSATISAVRLTVLECDGIDVSSMVPLEEANFKFSKLTIIQSK